MRGRTARTLWMAFHNETAATLAVTEPIRCKYKIEIDDAGEIKCLLKLP